MNISTQIHYLQKLHPLKKIEKLLTLKVLACAKNSIHLKKYQAISTTLETFL